MRPSRRLIAVVAGLLACAALGAAPAGAESTYNRVLREYEQTGSVAPCSFTSAQLEGVLKSVDTYAAQYFADFTNAIGTALAQRAAGACSPQRSAGSASVAPGLHNARLALPRVPTSTSAGVPLPIVLLAVIGGVLLVLSGAGLVWMLTGCQPRWAPGWLHSWDEAEDRVVGGWLALRDRLRGRRG